MGGRKSKPLHKTPPNPLPIKTNPTKTKVFSGASSVSISPDGTKFAIGSNANLIVSIYDSSSGSTLELNHDQQVYSVSWSPRGKQIASAGIHENKIYVWDVDNIQKKKFMYIPRESLTRYTDGVYAVSFSPDGKSIVSGSRDWNVRVWDVAKGDCTILNKHYGEVRSVAWSPDGKSIVSGSADAKIIIWTKEESIWKCTGTMDHPGIVRSVAWSPDGKSIVSGSADKTIKVWDVARGGCVQTLEGHTNEVSSVSFFPNGLYIVSSSHDKTIKVWDVSSGECVQTLEGHKLQIQSVAVSLDGTKIVSVSVDGALKVWEMSLAIIPGRESQPAYRSIHYRF